MEAGVVERDPLVVAQRGVGIIRRGRLDIVVGQRAQMRPVGFAPTGIIKTADRNVLAHSCSPSGR